MRKFIKGLFLDDVDEPCIGRFSLFIGLILTAFTAIYSIDTEGEMTMWEAIVRTSPGLIGLIAYCVSRAFECKEWIAEHAEKIIKNKNEKE